MASTGERIKALREEFSIKQSDLGKMLGVSDGTISDYEKDRTQPNIDKLRIMAQMFGTSTDYLIGHSCDRRTMDQQMAEVAAQEPEIKQIVLAAMHRKELRLLYGALKDIPSEDLQTLVRLMFSMSSAIRQDK